MKPLSNMHFYYDYEADERYMHRAYYVLEFFKQEKKYLTDQEWRILRGITQCSNHSRSRYYQITLDECEAKMQEYIDRTLLGEISPSAT